MKVADALRDISRLGLHTAPIVYFIENNPEFHAHCVPFFAAIDSGSITAFTSTVTLSEALVHPLRSGDILRAKAFRNLLLATQCISTIPVTVEIAEVTAQLRADYNMRTPDAIQFATSAAATALVETFNSSPLEVKVEAARALLTIASPQIPHLIDLLKNGDHAMRDGISWVLARTGHFNPSELVIDADDNLRKWITYIVGYGRDNFKKGDLEAICNEDQEVYFAASVLWQIVASWVNDLREY